MPRYILVLFIILTPLCIIWALNTLFRLAIPYTVETWFAVIVLEMARRGVFQEK